MNAIGGLPGLRLQSKNGMPKFAQRSRHVSQGFQPFQAHLGHLPDRHFLHQQLCLDKSQRANFAGDIEVVVNVISHNRSRHLFSSNGYCYAPANKLYTA